MFSAVLWLAAQVPSESEFMDLHARLLPAKDELWRSIPWKISLLEAREQAAVQKKPIFIWSMDGNPLAAG